MKLDEAIRVKENYQKIHSSEFYAELLEADNLSIEALKRVKYDREIREEVAPYRLPGETKD